jgi:hypothetical protein
MDALDFFAKILPSHGNFYLVLTTTKIAKNGQPAKFHKAFSDHHTLAAAVEKLDRRTDITAVYHACGSYLRPHIETDELHPVTGKPRLRYRVPENRAEAKAFWLDIDCGADKAEKGKGYEDKRAATTAVLRFSKQIGWPAPMLVSSGNGLHCYWPLEEEIPADEWVALAKWLKAATAHFGLLADPSRTADFASILRPIGSTNRKREHKAVKLMRDGDVTPFDDLKDALNAAIREHDIELLADNTPTTNGLNDDLTAHLDNFPKLDSSGALVADHCQQVAAMRDTQGDVDYEHWFSVLGVLKFCVDGRELAEEWTARRDETGHANVDWDAKLDTWQYGPSTCSRFQGCNPAGCEGCAHKGKIKSPIVLGRIVPETVEQVVETKSEQGAPETVVIPALPTGYSWDNRNMVRSLINKDGIVEPHAYCANLFYPTMRIRKEDATFNIGIRMHLPDSRTRDFEVPFEALASQTDMLRALARYELIQSNHKDSGTHMMAYLRDSMEKLKREVEEVNTLTTFGWKYDMQAFLMGDRLYHKDGTIRRVLLGGYAAGKKHLFPTPKGTLQGYAAPLNFIYNRPGLEPMQYALCSGWGSLLSAFCEDTYKGLMFSLYSGKSGTGKSTVCYNSLYAFGNADQMTKKSEDMGTKNELYAFVGTLNNIPMLFDELTKIDPEDLSALAYRISLGEERGRLKNTAGGTRFADAATWRMSPFVTSNKDLHALLSMTQANAEAESVRVVQIHLDDFNIPELKGADLQAFQMACDQIKLNAGSAGDAMIRYCVTHVDELYQRMRDKVTMLAGFIGEPKFRFYRNHAACTLVMAEIAKELGIVEFDLAKLTEFSIATMDRLRSNISVSTAVTPEDAYARMVSALASRVIVTSEYRDKRHGSGPETPRRPVVGEVAGRLISSPPSNKDPYRGRLMLASRDVKEWCTRNRVDYNTILSYLQTQKALISPHEKLRLTRGTDMSGGQTWCIVIDTLALEEAGDGVAPRMSLAVDNSTPIAVGAV